MCIPQLADERLLSGLHSLGRVCARDFRLVPHTPSTLRFRFWALDLLLRFPLVFIISYSRICIWCGRTNGVIRFVSLCCYCGMGGGELGAGSIDLHPASRSIVTDKG